MTQKSVLGRIQLNFYSHNEVSVIDKIPVPTLGTQLLLAFPFMFAAKMLYNFPTPSGTQVVDHALTELSIKFDRDGTVEKQDISLLGICCKEPLQIVGGKLGDAEKGRINDGKWIYAGEMVGEVLQGGGGLSMETEIARGDEDHFHRASIDVVFEWVRASSWELYSLMCSSVQDFFIAAKKNGVTDLQSNYVCAVEIANAIWKTLEHASSD
jgi:hypothetical protein